MDRVKKLYKQLKTIIEMPEMAILPGQLAFYFILMMIPILTVSVAILQQFDLTGSVSEILYDTIPNAVADLIVGISNERIGTVSFVALLISALIIASNGTYSMIVASNTIYKVKSAGTFTNRLKSLIMVLILILSFVVIFAFPIFGNYIIEILEKINIINIPLSNLFNSLKYPVTFIILFFFIKILYMIAPNVKVGLNKTSRGALFTSTMWIIVTILYSLYIEKVFSYETYYGGLSSILCLFIWVSIISYVFVLGMAINATYYTVDEEDKNYIEKGISTTGKVVKKIRRK